MYHKLNVQIFCNILKGMYQVSIFLSLVYHCFMNWKRIYFFLFIGKLIFSNEISRGFKIDSPEIFSIRALSYYDHKLYLDQSHVLSIYFCYNWIKYMRASFLYIRKILSWTFWSYLSWSIAQQGRSWIFPLFL